MRYLKEDINYNTDMLKKDFDKAADYTQVDIKVGGVNVSIVSLDGQIDKQYLTLGVIGKLADVNIIIKDINAYAYITKTVLAVCEQIEVNTVEDINEKIMLGFAVILIDGYDKAVAFGVQGFQFRSVSEPSNETMLRGSKEGFVEPLLINMSLVRRKLKTTDLKFEAMTLGSQSNTKVFICYLQNRVSNEILENIKKQLENIELKTVLAAGYLPGFLSKKGIFGNAGITERPDTVAAKIEEGRVAVIIDGTPSVLILPYLFVENFQCLDDYANKPTYASYIRIIKYIAFFIAVFFPAIYVGIISTRPELMPEPILVKIAQEEIATPLNVFWEVVLVNVLYEILRESVLRAPKALGQAVSILGALVVGDMAVSAGLIGASSIIIIAVSAISSYVVPKLYEQITILRFSLIVVGGLLGTWGVIFASVFIMFNISAANSFGIPVTSPVSPFGFTSMRDVFIRASWKKLNKNRNRVQDLPGREVGEE